MSEQQEIDTPAPSGDSSEKDHSTRMLMGGSIVAVIAVIGIAVSLFITLRGGDEPLVPAGDQGARAITEVQNTQFELDPYFDSAGRVVYVPLDERGVALPQSSPAANRSAATAPSEIMLQRVHGNMIVPFSTSDGPTGFSDSGVATGFARTPQGAGLAAVHYFGYLATGNNRIEMLKDAGLVEDTDGLLAEQIKYNAAGVGRANPDSSPYGVFEMIKVNYNNDLARVHLGATIQMKDGRTENRDAWTDLVWRDGTGWVLKIGDASTTSMKVVPDFADGWASWW
ncbi:UNVERIFIED_ORG: hypothetical protein FNL38_11176 [Nocardia globerula]|uniref:DUF8175 domain-containing protein n=2 Tax=Nocardiaceae TaxID=85025 RepID=A0A652YI58_NOCGL|nr:hypothetical protein [Nocardia globerula]